MKQWFQISAVLMCALLAGVSTQVEAQMQEQLGERELARNLELLNSGKDDRLPVWQVRNELGDMTGQAPLRISGVNTQVMIGFGGRFDRVVSAAHLQLNYQVSPAIIDTVTQVRVLINNEIMGVIPLTAAAASQNQSTRINLDPRVFTTYNEIRFELLSEVANGQCTSASPSAWFEVLRNSTLNLTYQQLKVANELAFFPEPWFDENDFSAAHIQLLLPPELSQPEIEASGIIASYFGMLADWREVNIHLDRLQAKRPDFNENWRQRWPEQHGIMLLTNEFRPWALRNLPKVSKPEVRMLDNPAYPAYKILALLAPDASSLRAAAATLVVSNKGLSGEYAVIEPRQFEPREDYQAPRWVPIDRPVTFAELIDHSSELQRTAANQSPINIELRLPPDLFTWQRYGIPIDLKFRYTPPVVQDESRMLVLVNNEFVKGFTLNASGTENTQERVRVPLMDSVLDSNNVDIPSFKLGAVNQLQLEFSFGSASDSCRSRPLMNAKGSIDANSSIDLRGYDHYIAMPDTLLFGKTGYPFTRWDDLSQTRVVIGSEANNDVLETLFLTLAKLSSASGYPATQLRVMSAAQVANDSDYDFLVIGQQALQQWIARFGDETLTEQLRGYDFAAQEQLLYAPELALRNSGPSAAVLSFESPLAAKRTVLALTATTDSYLARIREAMNDSGLTDQFGGFMTVLTPARVETYEPVQPYYVGTLSWWNRFTYHIGQYPLLVTLLGLFAVAVLALGLYRIFARKAQLRKQLKD